jgi:hypothetical protein
MNSLASGVRRTPLGRVFVAPIYRLRRENSAMEARLREEEASARDPVGGLPERPRLRLGCCWFEGADGLVVHSVRGAFRVPPSHVEAMRTIFARLDGRHDYEAVLGAVPTEQIGEAVAVWSAWNVIRSATMMTDGTWSAASDVATGPSDKAMEGPEVAVSDKGQAVAVWYRWTPDLLGPPSVIQAAAND